MNPAAKALVIAGAVLILAGLFWQFAGRFLPLGKLPGDIAIERPSGARFYFPVVTCLVASAVLTLLLNLFGRWLRK